jgi:hypothetical protein
MMKNKVDIIDKKTKIIIAITALFFVAILIANFYYLHQDNERDTFGEMFGVSTAIFTGFAFIGVFITFILQYQQIQFLQKEADKKSFEDTFFHLLSIHHELKKSLVYHASYANRDLEYHKIGGLEFFESVIKNFTYLMKIDINDTNHPQYNDTIKKFFISNNMKSLSHHFLHLQCILAFIKDNENIIKVEFYYKILKAQLSCPELTLNNLYNIGSDKMFEEWVKLH